MEKRCQMHLINDTKQKIKKWEEQRSLERVHL